MALALADEPGLVVLAGTWFDSRAVVTSRPLLVRRSDGDTGTSADPFDLLDSMPAGPTPGGAPGVFGGWFGCLGYQAGGLVERLPGSPPRPHPLPDWHLGWYDNVLRLDRDGTWWFEAIDTPSRTDVHAARLRDLTERLGGDRPRALEVRCEPFRLVPGGNDHRKAVRRALELIAAGDIYQANVCLRLESRLRAGRPIDVFAAGIERHHPPLSAHLDLGDGAGVSSLSPERFLRRVGDEVTTTPIKGTRRRRDDGRAPDPARAELAASLKDRAENVMIVDLMRNDLGRVCAPGSISVPRLFDIEAHPGLWHLVSEVTGRLCDEVGDGGLLRATFPPGSVTGAPKVRAMEILAEIEATGREVYTGSIGGVSPVAGAEWNVAIRTFEHFGDHLWMGVGGGIVADSDPEAELRECMTKASPLIDAVGASIELGSPVSEG